MRAHNSHIQTRRSRHRRIPVLMGGVRFLPTDIVGLQLWLDANDASTLFQDAAKTISAGDGDVVGAWADKSGLGNDATQATTAKKPTLQFNIINGLPVVRGDVDDDMTINVGALTNETIFVVSSHAVNNLSGVLFADTVTGTRLQYNSVVNRIDYRYNSQNVSITGGFVETSPNLFIVSYDGTNQNISVNEGAITSLPVTPLAHTYNRIFSRSANTLNGDIAEALIYNSALSTPNIVLIRDYIRAKWGTP